MLISAMPATHAKRPSGFRDRRQQLAEEVRFDESSF
jgi:hypothetical protein